MLILGEGASQQSGSYKDLEMAAASSLTMRGGAEECINDFFDTSKNLNGRIGIYKINFNKNLRRFQDIAAEQASLEPRFADLTNQFLSETLLPSIWGCSTLGQSSKMLQPFNTMNSLQNLQ